MDKIIALLKQIGASDELSKQITESLEKWTTDQKALLEGEYKERLKAAKDACLNEVNSYKNELAKKAQIFFETRSDKIEAAMAKQVAIRESAAEGKLKGILALLEGIQVNADGKVDLQAVKDQLAEAQKQVKGLQGQLTEAVDKANRAHGIAEKALKRNRQLESLLEESKKAPEKPTEPPAPATKPISEEKGVAAPAPASAPAPAAPAAATPAMPVRKTGAQPTTTTVVSEGTVATPAKKPEGEAAPAPAPKSMKWADPGSIASMMED